MPAYVRFIICLSMSLPGGLFGFRAVQVLTGALLTASTGPAPYGDWRPTIYSLVAGVPLGAAGGLLCGILLTRHR